MHELIIVGSGAAGYTAAIYAARAGITPALIMGVQPGGQLTTTTDVENYPGFAEPVQGAWLMEQMRHQAERYGTQMIAENVVAADLKVNNIKLTCASGAEYICKTIIIATGAEAQWLGMPSENKFRGFGVSACAVCDGFFFRGKRVVVVGGGNTAVEEAIYLTKHAEHVTLVHRRDQLRAERIMQERFFANPKISVIWNSVVDEILGTDMPIGVTGVRIKDVNSGITKELDIDGVFIAIGHKPAVDIFRSQVRLKANNYIWTAPYSTATNIPGVFAAGDVTDDRFRQAVTAAGMGCMAALEVEQYLASLG